MTTQASLDLVQKLYVAYYGRPADPSGQQYWAEQIDEQGVDSVINFFGTSPEFDARFGSMSNEQLVNNLYYQLFGREADQEGLDFYVGHLDAGNLTLAEIALTIATGAQNEDVDALNNKLSVAQSFTDAIDDPNEVTAYQGNDAANTARQFLVNVDDNTDPTGVDVDNFIEQLVKSSADPSTESVFTLTEIPVQTETELVVGGNGVPVDMALEFLQGVAQLDLVQHGLMDENGNLTSGIGNITIEDNSDGTAQVIIHTDDGNLLNLAFDGNLALVAMTLFDDYLDIDETSTQTGIVLTPTQNNGGAFESGYTTGANDLIVAGRPELLHGAYIDGAGGYNTLEVDMKGFFAQPFQLLNIQEVQVHNLSNVYDVGQTILGNVDLHNFPISNIDSGRDSFLDLSRADSLERLVITEGPNNGDLYIAGVKGDAVARLEGNFSEGVNLFYGKGLGDALELELANVTMQDGEFTLGHNAGTVNVLSEGRVNVLEDADFGAYLRELNVSGSGELAINSKLNFAFGEAYVDASQNTGGLRLSIGAQDLDTGTGGGVTDLLQEVTVIGTQERDVISVNNTDAGVVLDIDTNGGRDTLILEGVDAGRGSVIAGEELTIRVTGDLGSVTRLDLAQLPDDARFQIDTGVTLVVTQAQVDQLGIDAFGSLHRDGGSLKVLIQEDTDLSNTDFTDLVRELDLALELDDGVTLTATRAQLDNIDVIDARVASNDSSVVVTDLPADSQTDLGDTFDAPISVENIVISVDGLEVTDEFEITNSGANSPDATLSVAGDSDFSEANDITGLDAVEYAEDGASLTLTADQVIAIGEDSFAMAAGVTDATLDVTELGDDPIELGKIADEGINIGTLTVEDTGAVVALDATTTLGNADEVIVPEGTTLELTAAQFLQLDGGVISGGGTVNITDLTQADIDAGLDLSTITAEHGQITLLDNDVSMLVGTELGDFGVHLVGNDIDPNSPFDGQTIRFATADQAGREVTVSGDVSETNVVWLDEDDSEFVDGNGDPIVVDTAGYESDIGRLWISQELVEAAANNNVEALYTQLSSGIIARIYTDDLLAVSNPINRQVEIESFTQLNELTFNDIDADAPFEHVQNLDITLGGATDIGDLALDNLLDPSVASGDEFQTLTINSYLADADDHYLLPQTYDPAFDSLPSNLADPEDQWNVIGDIGSGPDRDQLANVVLTTSGGPTSETGVNLSVQTITFSETQANSTASLNVVGANDVTVKSLNTSDPDITALNINSTGSGALTVTSGSPAAAVSDTEELTIAGSGGDVTFGIENDDNGNPYAGVNGPELSLIDVTTGADVDLGVIAQVDSDDFTLNGTGDTTAVLGEANANGSLEAPELSATGTWTLNNLDLTLTEDVTLNAGGELVLNSVELTTEGDVDFSELDLTVTAGNIEVPAGSSLTLTAEQADGLTIEGDGEVTIEALEDAPAANLGGITAATTLLLTEDVAFAGTMVDADVTIDGAYELDVQGGTLETDTAFEVPAGASLVLTDTQADGLDVMGSGDARVVFQDTSNSNPVTSNADLSSIVITTTLVIEDGDGVEFNGYFNTSQAVSIESTVIQTPVDADEDFDITGAQNLPASVELDGVNLIATAAQLSGLTVTGASSVTVVELDATPDADLTGIESDLPLEIVLTDTVEFTGKIDSDELTVSRFGGNFTLDVTGAASFEADTVQLEPGATLKLTGAQADGLTIEGSGNVVVTDVGSGDDLSGIDVSGSYSVEAAAGVTTLSLTAEQADGAIVGGDDLTDVTITDLAATPDADLSQLKSGGGTYTAVAELDSDAITADLTADLSDVDTVEVSGNGTVTVDSADLTEFDFVADAPTLTMTATIADGLVTADTVGAGTVAVTELEGKLDADLSGIVANTETAAIDAEGGVIFTGDLGSDMAVVVTDSDDSSSDSLTIAASATLDSATTSFELNDNVELILDAGVASDLTVTNGDASATAVTVNDLDGDPLNLAGIAAATLTAVTATGPITLDAATDLGGFDVEVSDATTFTLNAAQADARSITGATATVSVTDLEATPSADLSGISAATETAALDVDGGVTFTGNLGDVTLTVDDSDAGSVDTLTFGAGAVIAGATITVNDSTNVDLAASIADGATMTVANGDVNVTGLENALDADLSGITTPAGDLNVALDSSGDVEIANGADLNDAVLTVSGNGTVTVEDGAIVTNVDSFVVEANATLVADKSLSADSKFLNGDVEGAGTLQVTGIDGEGIGLGQDIRFTEVMFGQDEADSSFADSATISNFEAGTFNWDGPLTPGVHSLDFTELLGTGLSFGQYATAAAAAGASEDILAFDTYTGTLGDEAAMSTQFGGHVIGNTGDSKVLMVADGNNPGDDTGIWLWTDGDLGTQPGSGTVAADGQVDTGELSYLGTLEDVNVTGLGNLVDDNFVLA